MNSLSNKDLIEIYKKYNIQLRDVLNKDKITSDLPFGFYIINLQKSNEGEGTHWCALYYNIVSIWFDPFGFPPPREIIDNIDNYIKPLRRNKEQYGWYVLIDRVKADFGGVHITLDESKKSAREFIISLKESFSDTSKLLEIP